MAGCLPCMWPPWIQPLVLHIIPFAQQEWSPSPEPRANPEHLWVWQKNIKANTKIDNLHKPRKELWDQCWVSVSHFWREGVRLAHLLGSLWSLSTHPTSSYLYPITVPLSSWYLLSWKYLQEWLSQHYTQHQAKCFCHLCSSTFNL